jgi:hypothetical protein
VFWAAGFNGLQVLQQIFVADTTDLLNRALYSTIFDIPFLWTTFAGPEVANSILKHSTWRWGYGIWAIVLPVCFIPLAVSLFMLVIGGVLCIVFPFWERSKKLAPKAFFPPNLFQNRTVIAGVAIAFFYFSRSGH